MVSKEELSTTLGVLETARETAISFGKKKGRAVLGSVLAAGCQGTQGKKTPQAETETLGQKENARCRSGWEAGGKECSYGLRRNQRHPQGS